MLMALDFAHPAGNDYDGTMLGFPAQPDNDPVSEPKRKKGRKCLVNTWVAWQNRAR